MFLAKSYCDIGNSQSSSSIVAPDGEITTTFEYDDHIGASIKDLGKSGLVSQRWQQNSSKSESPHFGAIFRLQEAFSRCINNSFANWLPELVNAEDCIKAFQGICLIQI